MGSCLKCNIHYAECINKKRGERVWDKNPSLSTLKTLLTFTNDFVVCFLLSGSLWFDHWENHAQERTHHVADFGPTLLWGSMMA